MNERTSAEESQESLTALPVPTFQDGSAAVHCSPMSQPHRYRYYEFVLAAFVTVLVCSNLIGPAKVAQLTVPVVGTITFGAGVLFFPVSYVFGDVLTEVYGYARARRVIWCGFGALAFASLM